MNAGMPEARGFIPTKGLPEGYERYFIPRPEDILRINQSLANLVTHHPDGLRFVGERGIGKTSLFTYLERIYCQQLSILPIYVDAKNKNKIQLIAEIFHTLRTKAIKEKGLYKWKRIWWFLSNHIKKVNFPYIGEFQLSEETFARTIHDDMTGHINDLRDVGIAAVLIMLDDADHVNISDLGEVASVFHTIPGCVTYIATGYDTFSKGATVTSSKVTSMEAGISASWRRMILRPFSDDELSNLIDSYLQKSVEVMNGNDRDLLAFLSRGNGRLAMTLLSNSRLWGRETKRKKHFLHITTKVIEKAREEEEGLEIILDEQVTKLRSRDPYAIKPQWW